MDTDGSSSSNARLPRSAPRPHWPMRALREPRLQRARRTQRSHRPQHQQPPQPQQQPGLPRRDGSRRDDSGGPGHADSTASTTSAPVTRKIRAVLSKRLKFLTEIMTHLDMIVYAELCTLYYMECSLFRLILRAVPQSLFLSPKSEEFMLITPAQRPHVLAVFVPNAVCVLFHLLGHTPQGTEASRGYLNGGVLIDFVGQRAPSSRWALLFFDLVVFAVQCLMLAVHTQREQLRKQILPLKGALAVQAGSPEAAVLASGAVRTNNMTPNQALALAASTVMAARRAAAQDYDAEERGFQRGEEAGETGAAGETGDGIEMQPLDGGNADENDGTWGPRRLSPEEQAQKDLDALSSGCNLCDFYVVHAVQEASGDYQGVAAQSMQTMSYASSLARLATRRGMRPAATAAAAAAAQEQTQTQA